MPLHLIKLCVGVRTLSDLAALQAERLEDKRRAGQTPELFHVTRNMPKRGDEILPGGSLYWVMKGWIVGRQRLLEFRPIEKDGIRRCALVLDAGLVTVEPRARRPFQGWRYLAEKDAPPELRRWSGGDDLPDDLRRELASLGLL